MIKILIADSEEADRVLLKEYAEYDGYIAVQAVNGRQAAEEAYQNEYDLIIIDTALNKPDGYSVVKEIRKNKDTPIIMVSTKDDEYDRLFGFEVGADDFVTKPFYPKEVMARVAAILKRGKRSTRIIKSGGLEVDISGRSVCVDGEKCRLTPKEYELLFYLVNNAGMAISREKLLTDVWGFEFYGDDRTVDTHIKMLRASLGPYRHKIVTLRGLGYKIEI